MTANGHGMQNANMRGDLPIIRKKSDYQCPVCGDVPYVNDDGTPEAFVSDRKGFKMYMCIPCGTAWQHHIEQLMPFQVPRLAKVV